jgi:hypothetical protein
MVMTMIAIPFDSYTTIPFDHVHGFDYIHAPNCYCSAPGVDYAASLSRVRHALVEVALTDEQREASDLSGSAWGDVCERVPDGSCLAWLDGDGTHATRGWPRDHRDYHLLVRWGDAKITETYAHDARQALASSRAARDAAGWNGWDHIGCSCASCEHDRRLVDASIEADKTAAEAGDLLARVLQAASWGAQPDGSFVTRHTAYSVASGRYVHTLHAPAKQGPLAEARDPESWASYQAGAIHLTALRTREEARAIRETERARNRREQEEYAGARRAAAVGLRNGRSLPYVPGQEYGAVRTPHGVAVSARGALVAAGLTREQATALLSIDVGGLDDGYPHRSLRLSLRGIEVTP